jgi:RNA ligase (TIGR02306 family)
MSTFSASVVRISALEPIPGADMIELAIVGDYQSIVPKGQFKIGDKAVYLKEFSVLPDNLIAELGLIGKLAGPGKNYIRAIYLRKHLSQGILYKNFPGIENLNEGVDVAGELGITRYEPVIPAHMGGEIFNAHGLTLKYDIENFKAFPNILQTSEMVEFTEKVHGTFCGCAVIPGLNNPDAIGSDAIVYSKGLGDKGLCFKDNQANATNLYLQIIKSNNLPERIKRVFPNQTIHVLGEIYGFGVQDLQYNRKDRGLIVFDIYLGEAGKGKFANRQDLAMLAKELGLTRVPVLYSGPFSKEIMYEYTDGKTIVGNGSHIREGVVVTPITERKDNLIGRVILKSVSGNYLTRMGNATEFN